MRQRDWILRIRHVLLFHCCFPLLPSLERKVDDHKGTRVQFAMKIQALASSHDLFFRSRVLNQGRDCESGSYFAFSFTYVVLLFRRHLVRSNLPIEATHGSLRFALLPWTFLCVYTLYSITYAEWSRLWNRCWTRGIGDYCSFLGEMWDQNQLRPLRPHTRRPSIFLCRKSKAGCVFFSNFFAVSKIAWKL